MSRGQKCWEFGVIWEILLVKRSAVIVGGIAYSFLASLPGDIYYSELALIIISDALIPP